MKRRLQALAATAQKSHSDLDGPDVLSQVEVCARLGISDETWRRWRVAKRTPDAVVMPSGRLKWRREDIDRIACTGLDEALPRSRYFGSVYRRRA